MGSCLDADRSSVQVRQSRGAIDCCTNGRWAGLELQNKSESPGGNRAACQIDK